MANMATDCGCGDRHEEADGEGREDRHGRADRIRAHGMDADVDGVHRFACGRKAVCGHREREGNGAEQLSPPQLGHRAEHNV